MTAAEIIHDAREKAGLTQAQLAERAGITQSVVSAYERGRREPSYRVLVDLLWHVGADIRIEIDVETTPTLAYVRSKKAELEKALGGRGAHDIRVFGSVVRGDAKPGSDVDLLVRLDPDVGIEFFGMSEVASEILGVPVDVVPDNALKPYAKDNILAEAVPL